MFLSLHACKSLEIITKHFPYPAMESDTIQNEAIQTKNQCSVESTRIVQNVHDSSIKIPFEPTEGNIMKVKLYSTNLPSLFLV